MKMTFISDFQLWGHVHVDEIEVDIKYLLLSGEVIKYGMQWQKAGYHGVWIVLVFIFLILGTFIVFLKLRVVKKVLQSYNSFCWFCFFAIQHLNILPLFFLLYSTLGYPSCLLVIPSMQALVPLLMWRS